MLGLWLWSLYFGSMHHETGAAPCSGTSGGRFGSGGMGIIIGLPTLRLKGDYLAIATLGMGEIIRVILINIDYVGGASGLSPIPKLTNWTWIFFITVGTVLL